MQRQLCVALGYLRVDGADIVEIVLLSGQSLPRHQGVVTRSSNLLERTAARCSILSQPESLVGLCELRIDQAQEIFDQDHLHCKNWIVITEKHVLWLHLIAAVLVVWLDAMFVHERTNSRIGKTIPSSVTP